MRQPDQKRMAWIDLKMIKKKLQNLVLKLQNNKLVAGVDEVGRGCLAGPVVSAVVILKKTADLKSIKDSKKLSFALRLKIAKHIKKHSFYSIGIASVQEIYKINILQSISLLSMKRALKKKYRKNQN